MSDHLENIRDAYQRALDNIRSILETGETSEGEDARAYVLDCQRLRSDDLERERFELYIGLGGPTVWFVVDTRWLYGTFHHSWGEWNGEPREEWDATEEETDALLLPFCRLAYETHGRG